MISVKMQDNDCSWSCLLILCQQNEKFYVLPFNTFFFTLSVVRLFSVFLYMSGDFFGHSNGHLLFVARITLKSSVLI